MNCITVIRPAAMLQERDLIAFNDGLHCVAATITRIDKGEFYRIHLEWLLKDRNERRMSMIDVSRFDSLMILKEF